MNYQDPPLKSQAENVTYNYESAAKKDARLQADPELASSEGCATLPAVAVYFTAMVFVVCVVLWGLNHQRDETVTNAAAPAAEAPANDARQTPQQQGNAPAPQQQGNNNATNPQQGQNNQQGQASTPANQPQGQNPPPKQSQDNQQPAQPQQNAEKPAAQQNQPANAQQQNAPAPKQ